MNVYLILLSLLFATQNQFEILEEKGEIKEYDNAQYIGVTNNSGYILTTTSEARYISLNDDYTFNKYEIVSGFPYYVLQEDTLQTPPIYMINDHQYLFACGEEVLIMFDINQNKGYPIIQRINVNDYYYCSILKINGTEYNVINHSEYHGTIFTYNIESGKYQERTFTTLQNSQLSSCHYLENIKITFCVLHEVVTWSLKYMLNYGEPAALFKEEIEIIIVDFVVITDDELIMVFVQCETNVVKIGRIWIVSEKQALVNLISPFEFVAFPGRVPQIAKISSHSIIVASQSKFIANLFFITFDKDKNSCTVKEYFHVFTGSSMDNVHHVLLVNHVPGVLGLSVFFQDTQYYYLYKMSMCIDGRIGWWVDENNISKEIDFSTFISNQLSATRLIIYEFDLDIAESLGGSLSFDVTTVFKYILKFNKLTDITVEFSAVDYDQNEEEVITAKCQWVITPLCTKLSDYTESSNDSNTCVEHCDKKWLIMDEWFNCVDECPESDRFDIPELSNKCVSECPDEYYLQGKHCVKECRTFYEINRETRTCVRKQIFSATETPDEIVWIIKDIVGQVYENENTIIENGDVTIQIYNTTKAGQDEAIISSENNKISSIDFTHCETLLRVANNIPDGEPLLIWKLDIYREGQITNQIEYSVYDITGKLLSWEVCKDIEITISLPITNTEYLRIETGENLSGQGVDIYDSSDDFFNDLCITFTSDSNTDVTLKDRRDDFYVNASFCEEGCTYKGINYTTLKVNCTCNVKEEMSGDEATNPISTGFKNALLLSNIYVVNCFSLVFTITIFKQNIGNYILLVLFLSQIGTTGVFVYFGVDKIRKWIYWHVVDTNSTIKHYGNPPRQNKASQQEILEGDVDSLRYSGGELDHKSSKYLKSKKNVGAITIAVNPEPAPMRFQEKSMKSSNETREIYRFKEEIDSSDSLNKIAKGSEECDSPVHKKYLGKNIINGDVINIKNKKKRNPSQKFELKSLSNNNMIGSSTVQTEKKTAMSNKYDTYELNYIVYQDALKCDKRAWNITLLSLIVLKHPLIFSFFVNDKYTLKTINISWFLFSWSMSWAFNALFYTDSYISQQYHNAGSWGFWTSIPKSLYSFLFSVAISIIVSLLTSSKRKLMNKILWTDTEKSRKINNNKNKIALNKKPETHLNMNIANTSWNGGSNLGLIKCIKIKLVFYFIFMFICNWVFWYYVTAFCAVYRNSQKNWWIGATTTIIIGMITPLGIAVCIFFLRVIGLKKHWKFFYNISILLV